MGCLFLWCVVGLFVEVGGELEGCVFVGGVVDVDLVVYEFDDLF